MADDTHYLAFAVVMLFAAMAFVASMADDTRYLAFAFAVLFAAMLFVAFAYWAAQL